MISLSIYYMLIGPVLFSVFCISFVANQKHKDMQEYKNKGAVKSFCSVLSLIKDQRHNFNNHGNVHNKKFADYNNSKGIQ